MVEEVTRLDVSTRLSRRLLVDAPVLATTHQELADRLGCSRERVSRLLEGFQTSGWVQLSQGVIRVVDTSSMISSICFLMDWPMPTFSLRISNLSRAFVGG